MISKELITKKIGELDVLASTIEVCIKQILEETPITIDRSLEEFPSYHWGYIPEGLNMLQRDALNQYQCWYSSAYQLIKEYNSEKIVEFKSCYDGYPINGVLNYIQMKCSLYSTDKKDVIKRFVERFNLQRSILYSVPYVIEMKELSLRKIITADFIDSELEQAELLFKIHPRAAGSIAGVALEKYLKTQCDLNGVSYSRGTIKPLADALKAAGKLNSIELGQIEFLARVRNQCVHATGEEIPDSQIRSFIDQIRRIVNS